jgi:hypothetical protein
LGGVLEGGKGRFDSAAPEHAEKAGLPRGSFEPIGKIGKTAGKFRPIAAKSAVYSPKTFVPSGNWIPRNFIAEGDDMFNKKLKNKEAAASPKDGAIKAKPRIDPPAVPDKEQDAIHQPGIIFSGLKEKLSSEELLKRME